MTCEYRTLHKDRAHFNADAISQCGVSPRDLDRLGETVGLEHKITTNRFFRLGERSVEDEPSVRARDHPALTAEWLGRSDLAAFVQFLEPLHHFVHSLLKLVRGK